jgi:precorrin-6A/cobalt-precorrin-6A reductase
MKRVLILGGTGDAVKLAAKISEDPNFEVITSLAGRTHQPAPLPGNIRIGGFGGVTGLAIYLREQQIAALIDATHPFAAQMSWNAAIAAQETHTPHLMVYCPGWQKSAGDRWIEVETIDAAAAQLPNLARRVFLTTGRQQLAPFAALTNIWFLMRSIDPPDPGILLPQGIVLLERGPFSLEHERQLLQKYQIDAIVSKNSGGDATYAKILAARELEIPVMMVQRPEMPPVEMVSGLDEVMNWLSSCLM